MPKIKQGKKTGFWEMCKFIKQERRIMDQAVNANFIRCANRRIRNNGGHAIIVRNYKIKGPLFVKKKGI